jgi:hypothetical protein
MSLNGAEPSDHLHEWIYRQATFAAQFYCCAHAMIIAAVVLSSIPQLRLPFFGHEIKC